MLSNSIELAIYSGIYIEIRPPLRTDYHNYIGQIWGDFSPFPVKNNVDRVFRIRLLQNIFLR